MRLASIGSNCVDFYTNIDGGKAFAGGGPVNMGVYAIRLGGTASYIGPVGNDTYGRFMIEEIKKKGIDTSHLYIKDGKTAVSNVSLIDGERVFGDYDEGVLKEYSLSKEDIEFILTHDVVVADLWGRVEGYFKDFKDRGMTTAFDLADNPDSERVSKAIPYVDYLFFSSNVDDMNKVMEKMKALKAMGPKLVVSMLGSSGSICYDGTVFIRYGIKECDNIVDTMGAGDSYIAGFLTGIISGRTIEEAMELGAETATETLRYFGAW